MFNEPIPPRPHWLILSLVDAMLYSYRCYPMSGIADFGARMSRYFIRLTGAALTLWRRPVFTPRGQRPRRPPPAPEPGHTRPFPMQIPNLDRAAFQRALREFGWLAVIIPRMEVFRAPLEALLVDPALDTWLDTDPRLTALLRRLSHMLGVDPNLMPPTFRPAQPAADPAIPLPPEELRRAPAGYARHRFVNEAGYVLMEAERAAWLAAPAVVDDDPDRCMQGA